MGMYVCVLVYVSMCMGVYVCVLVYVCVWVCGYAREYVCIYVCMRVRICVCGVYDDLRTVLMSSVHA